MANSDIYQKIWRSVEELYRKGFCWSERGLQAALYSELRKHEGFNVVVEPTWGQIPDLVVVRDGEITDILELKFSPHTKYPREWEANHHESDIQNCSAMSVTSIQ